MNWMLSYPGFKIFMQAPNISLATYFCNQKRTMDKEKRIFVIIAFVFTHDIKQISMNNEIKMLVDKEK